ncbi:MAG: histidine phosphatase family protein [Nitrosomonadales bacterium]|nr:histidine phosphatase family protein [Nitrosomonadales bacterium]
MELILWRHAEAEDGTPDLERQLTARGEKQADKMAAFLRPRLPQKAHVLASPARRTQQTAQALTRNFTTEPTIAPGASAPAILKAAGWPNKDGCTLIVGHQPTLGEVAALLMTGKTGYWNIKKGAVWWFGNREREGHDETVLRLVIAPDQL